MRMNQDELSFSREGSSEHGSRGWMKAEVRLSSPVYPIFFCGIGTKSLLVSHPCIADSA